MIEETPAEVFAARPSSLDTREQVAPITTSQTPAEVSKGRRRLFIPTVPRRRDRRKPDEAYAEEQRLDTLKRNCADAIVAVLGQTKVGDRIGGIELTDKTRIWLARKARALRDCREVRAFREAQCGTYEVVPVSCDARVCPHCERSRAARVMRAATAIVEQVEPRRRSYAVLTIRNVPDLLPGLQRLDRAIASLRRRALFSGGRCRWRTRDGKPGHPCTSVTCTKWTAGRHRPDRNCPDFRHDAVTGGGRFHEVTFNLEDRTWHPHSNLLLDAPYLVHAELSDTWRAITCSDAKHRRAGWCPRECVAGSPVVWIEAVNPRTVREAVKYVAKIPELIEGDDPVQLVEFLLATRGRRMVQGFGSFYGLEIVEEEQPKEGTVTVFVDTGEHDSGGGPIIIRYRLPRFCRQCGRDTRIDESECTYEQPIVVPRRELRLRNGVQTWKPPPR